MARLSAVAESPLSCAAHAANDKTKARVNSAWRPASRSAAAMAVCLLIGLLTGAEEPAGYGEVGSARHARVLRDIESGIPGIVGRHAQLVPGPDEVACKKPLKAHDRRGRGTKFLVSVVDHQMHAAVGKGISSLWSPRTA